MRTTHSRRTFLGASAAATLAPFALGADAKLDLAFFIVGDTHYLADKQNPKQLDATSAGTNARLVDTLNKLPGTAIPAAAGGGTVAIPKGVIHDGDLIDSGDKTGGSFPQMHETEWQGFQADFGLTGKDGRLKFPVYEVHGNHDSPPGDGLIVKKIAERNKTRPGVTGRSSNGLHYSWDWESVHFVNLGIVVGAVKSVTRKRKYNPLDSLEFLAADLAASVGKSGRPVILTHHVDVLRYATNPDKPTANPEWDPADVRAYYDAIKDYNVVAIFYGHTHARNIYQWDGSNKKAEKGVSVFNVDNSGHYSFKQQAGYYVHLSGDTMTVREFATADRWETFDWTAEKWERKIPATKG
ncbi:metallophosphoesterase [Limnoglobus roseus]|uniref:Calcineurin-like phosphoesterase domain-containing protein n=1 Tax=Limnoglobus roseus TaxID=2598579 RepID=A0A5C1ABN8_9BACT|nr:metallophosphoesterase [Limnoglobus roseus]QEL16120.1 hypothetical protein PX52LOC_03059 [Limnoglobus roseus]